MKHLWLLSLSVLACVGIAELLPPGGTTFNFEQMSDDRHKRGEEAGENLLVPIGDTVLRRNSTNGVWTSHYEGIWGQKNIEKEFRQELLSLFQYQVKKLPDGRHALVASIPSEVENRAGAAVASGAGAGFSCSLELNELLCKKKGFQFNFDYAYDGVSGYVILSGHEGDNSKKPRFSKTFTLGSTGGDWKHFQGEFILPSTVNHLSIFLRGHGTGTLKLASPELSPVENLQPATVRVRTMAHLDNRFGLTQNDPSVLIFEWRLNVPPESVNLKSLKLMVKFPKDVEFLGYGNSDETQLLTNTVSEKTRNLEFSLDQQSRGTGMQYRILSAVPLLLRSKVKPGSELGSIEGILISEGKAVSERFSMPLMIEESIISPRKCKLYYPGIHERSSNFNFSSREAEQIVAEFYGKMGVRWISSGLPGTFMRECFRRNGVKIIAPSLWHIANGYRIIAPGKVPEHARFVTTARDYEHEPVGVCPRIVYLRDTYYTEKIEPFIQKQLIGTDGLWANWEPQMFFGRGCFCEGCISEFADFIKQPKEKVALLIPQQVVGGGEYAEKWRKFRSLQHAKLAKTIHESVMKATTGKIGFIPGPVLYYMTSLKAYQDTELDVRDYLPELKYINPWGPYNCWVSSQPYPVRRASSINAYLGAECVNEFRSQHFKQQNPGILALPHGVQCDDWVTNPESIAMDLESFFLNGYQAAAIYVFPYGYDNRYWRAFAEASERIATVEEFVVHGERKENPILQALSPFPAKLLKLDPRWMEFIPKNRREGAPFRTQRYEKNGETLLVVGNFWEKGDLFFKALLPGFSKNTHYQVSGQPDNQDWGIYTGKELADGIKLHTGALRWSYFKIATVSSPPQLTAGVSDVEYDRILTERLPQLKQAMIAEDKRDAAEAVNTQTVELATVNSGKLQCVPQKDGQSFAFSSGENNLLIASDGMAINHWIINGSKLVDDSPPFGLGYLCFYQPPLQISGEAFKITALQNVEGGIELTGKLHVTDRLNMTLSGLIIEKKAFVSDDLRYVTMKTRLLNSSTPEEPKAFFIGARGHARPLFWNTHPIKLGNRTLTRRYQNDLFTFHPDHPDVRTLQKMFKVKEITQIPPAKAEFTDGKLTLRETVTPARLHGGFLVWDSPTENVTWESYFLPIELEAGQAVDYGFSYELVP